MTMETELRSRLMFFLGSVPVDWSISAQGLALPRVVLWQISGGADYATTGPTGLRTARLQINCYGAEVAAAKGLAAQVTAAISGWRVGAILGVFLDSAADLAPDTTVPLRVFGVALDFIVHFHQE